MIETPVSLYLGSALAKLTYGILIIINVTLNGLSALSQIVVMTMPFYSFTLLY